MPPKTVSTAPKVEVIQKQNRENPPVRPEAPKSPQGYIHIRRGIFEHTRKALMGTTDFCVYLAIHNFCNFDTGVALSNADALVHVFPADLTDKLVEKSMRRMRERGYIAYRFGRGRRGEFPILVNKFEPRNGFLTGWRLRADISYDLNDPIYEYVSATKFHNVYADVLDDMNFAQKQIDAVLQRCAAEDPDVLRSCAGGAAVWRRWGPGEGALGFRTRCLYSSSVVQEFSSASSSGSTSNSSSFVTNEEEDEYLLNGELTQEEIEFLQEEDQIEGFSRVERNGATFYRCNYCNLEYLRGNAPGHSPRCPEKPKLGFDPEANDDELA